ncbi:ABC transporter permease [Legionella genomosp. 1]|uniref:ABC transporter permease n=1 Tax=Legionella genomosp. 1 TaxID=1093625 RepID=UPI001055E3B8|nr:ABC transporter permease [Legionella genomosp. 1]
MNWFNHFQQALVNLTASKMRSFLAVLGVLVGTAAIVALISCGQLATEKALEQFKALGTDLLAATVFQKERGQSTIQSELPLSFWRSLPSSVPSILKIAPYATAYQPVSFNGRPLQSAIIGADDSLADIIHIKLERGYFVSFLSTFEHFCVIGDDLARQIREITLDDPVGKKIRIGNSLYTIIGVVQRWQENGFFNEDVNHSVIVPVAGISLISKDSKVNNAVMLLKPESDIDLVISQIKQQVESQAPRLTLFTRSAKQIIASMESQGQIFTLLLAVIGGISLLVGGIGVMNVMLVSVSERKKEIGIRKAVGAKNSEIQNLFLVESVLLSFLGGGLGVLLGLVFTRVVAYFSDWTFILHSLPPLAGFAVSVATGIFFGFYPARRASKLEPIMSLRSE